LDIYLLRALVFLYLDQPDDARIDFNHVVNSNPMKIDGLLGMSKFYNYVQNLDSAVYFTNVAMMMSETFEDQKNSLVSRGEIYLNNGQFKMAESSFLKAYEMDQNDYTILEKVTLTLHGQGKDEEAFRYLDMITDENEINGKSLTKMADLTNKISMYGEANLYL
jgi:tetratricopeptide (TPR) repeat protein